MDPVFFELGSVEIRWYSVLICVAIVLGMLLLNKEGKRFKIPGDFLFNLCFWAIIAAFIGARLYYVVFNWSYYGENLSEILKTWNGGLAIHGGILAGFMAMAIYCKKYGVKTLKITDMVAVPLLLGQTIGRWGNFFNGESHGIATTLTKLQELPIPQFVIDGMNIGGVYYQPTFYYESMWCLLGVIVLLVIRRLKYIKIGQLTAFYFMWYSVGRFFIESIRTDSLMFGAFRTAQLMSITLFIIGLISFMILSRKSRFEDLYNEENQEPVRF